MPNITTNHAITYTNLQAQPGFINENVNFFFPEVSVLEESLLWSIYFTNLLC